LPAGAIAGGVGGGALLAVYRLAGGLWELAYTAALDEAAYDMAAGSLDGSAREQIVVPQRLAGEIWVMEQASPLEMFPVAILPATGATGSMGPFSVTLIDPAGDGLVDIAAGLYDGDSGPFGSVSVFRHLAPFEFAPEEVLPVIAFLPIVRALPDVVRGTGGTSGAPDLAVLDALVFANVVQIFAGEDSFLSFPALFANTGPSTSALAADFDGDGVLDLAFTLFDSGGVAVRLGLGGGDYGPARLYNVGPVPRALQSFDLDLNGRADLGVATMEGASVMLALPGGRFRAAEGFSAAVDPQFPETADIDGDGLLDIVVIDVRQRAISFLRGLPGRQFELSGAVPLADAGGDTPAYFDLGDVDGDALPDIVVTAAQSGTVHVLRGGTMPPAPGQVIAVGSHPRGIALGDLDGDGDLDALVAIGETPGLRILRNLGGVFVAEPPMPLANEPLAVVLTDLDGDGNLDAVITDTVPSVRWFQGDGRGTFTPRCQFALPAPSITLRTGDVVVDARPDVVVGQTGFSVSQLVLLENRGQFDLAPRFVPVDPDPGTAELVDIDGDGVLDILVPTGTGRLALLGNDGKGNFAPLDTLLGLPLDVPFVTRGSTMADLDFDGRPELIMTSPFSRQVWVARNNSFLPAAQ
jgi:hypothetical protein